MKKLRVLSSGAVLQLKSQIHQNVTSYQSGSRDWLDNYFSAPKNTILSIVDDSAIVLKTGKSHSTEFDAYNAQLLFEGYPTITPAIAADERIWVSLCHNQHYEYMLNRWPIVPDESHHQTEEGIIRQRYFFGYGLRKSQERNGLSRLWLSAALTYDPSRQDPYELTKVLLQDTNFIMYLFGHTFGSNRNIVQGTLEAISQLQQETGNKVSAKPLKSFTEKLNLLSGVTMLDRYSCKEICVMAKEHISNHIKSL